MNIRHHTMIHRGTQNGTNAASERSSRLIKSLFVDALWKLRFAQLFSICDTKVVACDNLNTARELVINFGLPTRLSLSFSNSKFEKFFLTSKLRSKLLIGLNRSDDCS